VVAKKQLVVAHAEDIEAIIARVFSQAEDIQPWSAECYPLLYDFDPTRVLGLCFVDRYQVTVHMFAASRLEGFQILPELCDVADPKENEVLCDLIQRSGCANDTVDTAI